MSAATRVIADLEETLQMQHAEISRLNGEVDRLQAAIRKLTGRERGCICDNCLNEILASGSVGPKSEENT